MIFLENIVTERKKPTNRADQRKFHVIYKTTCLVTGKWYIGMHSTDDLDDGYLGSGQVLSRSVKKHGKSQHVYEVLEHHPSRKSVSEREEELLTKEFRANPLCMNIAGGGIGHVPGHRNSEESKLKNSIASKEMWERLRADPAKMAARSAKLADPKLTAHRAKMNTGKKRSAEQLANLQAGQQSYYASADAAVLKERGQKSAKTKLERGTNKGGRPKGISMSEAEKLKLGERMRGNSPLSRRGMCAGCGKETTLVALNRWHASCRTPHA